MVQCSGRDAIIHEGDGAFMLKCGQEEPIIPNDYIHQHDEIMHWSVLSDVEDPRLNRYSFVWLGRWSEGQSA